VLHVVTLIDTLNTGGAERLAVDTTAALDATRFRRTLCISRRPYPGLSEAHRELLLGMLCGAGVEVLQLERSSSLSIASWRPLLRLLRGGGVDVLHAHKFGSNVNGMVLGRLARVPVLVAHEHTWSYEGQPLRKLLDREVIGRWADAFVAVSREDARRMREVEGVRPDVVRFVPIGIGPQPVGDGSRVRAELGIDPGAPVIGTVAVLRAQKAFPVLIRAAALIRREHPGLQVLIAGDGDAAPLRRLGRELGVADRLRFLGPRTDVPDVIASLDVAVSSSDFEGSPLSVMEYMAAGRAIVATRVGGLPDLIEDGVEGRLVPRRDPEALALAVTELLREPALRAGLGAAARRRQHAEFTLAALTGRLEALYEELWTTLGSDRADANRARPSLATRMRSR
jgi:glycosyltransferase involved in cell wall biosynthesis